MSPFWKGFLCGGVSVVVLLLVVLFVWGLFLPRVHQMGMKH